MNRKTLYLLGTTILITATVLWGMTPEEGAAVQDPKNSDMRVESKKIDTKNGVPQPITQLNNVLKHGSKASTSPDVTKMDEATFRQTMNGLLERVETLEREVAELKDRKPRIELLSK